MQHTDAPGHVPPSERPVFRIREATAEDNTALLALDRQCVMAAATPVMFDRSPDFFARSRPYAYWRAYVAEAEQGLIGVAAMALKPALVEGRPIRAAYFYDLRVAPEVRRLGVAKAVGEALRAHTRSLSPAVVYSLVMEGNVPSLAFAGARGARALRSGALSLIPVETVPAADPERARPLGASDIPAALALVRAGHPNRDLLPFPDAASLGDRIERIGPIGFRGLYGWDAEGKLAGCFGVWDYSPVMRMRLLETAGEWTWAAGRDLHLVFLMPLGFRDGGVVAEAVRLAAARLRQVSAAGAAWVLAIAHDLGDTGYAALEAFRPLRLGFTLFGVYGGGADNLSLGTRPAFVDPADL